MDDLDRHPEVIAEAIQTILRREGLADAYDKLKDFSRTGESLSLQHLQAFVRSLQLNSELENELMALQPRQYLGDFLH
jgi:adenylosuccinate lyase